MGRTKPCGWGNPMSQVYLGKVRPRCGMLPRLRRPFFAAHLPMPTFVDGLCAPLQVQVTVNGQEVLAEKVSTLRGWWEATSFQLERLQANPDCVAQEEMGLTRRIEPGFTLTFNPQEELPLLEDIGTSPVGAGRRGWDERLLCRLREGAGSRPEEKGRIGNQGFPSPAMPAPRVAILREEGSNGDREMVSAFLMAGFQVSWVGNRGRPQHCLRNLLAP